MDKAYLRRTAVAVLAVIFAVAMAFYFGYHIMRFFSKDVDTVPASDIEKIFSSRCEGYVFRSEEIVPMPISGVPAASVADGTHVHVGEEIAGVYSVANPQAEDNLRLLSEQLSLLQDYAATSRGAKDAAAVDQRIYSIMAQIKELSANNDLAGVCEMRAKLLAELNGRDVIAGTSSEDFDSLITDVEASIASEKAKLGAQKGAVTASRAGWYFSETDGFESVFNVEYIDAMTLPLFRRITAEAAQPAGNIAGKLVLDHMWYFVFETDSYYSSMLNESDRIPVSFAYNGGETLQMRVYRVVDDPDSDRSVVILTSSEVMPGFSFERCQTVDVTFRSVSGFSVPVSAVRMVDGERGVYIFNGVYAKFRRVIVLLETDEYYIVKTDSEIAQEQEWESQRALESERKAESEAASEAAERGETLPPKETDPPETDPPEPAGTGEAGENEEDQTETEKPFVASEAPYLSANDLIVVEGKDMYEGKLIS